MGIKLALTSMSVSELRTLASQLTTALANIDTATSTVNNAYQSVKDNVGPHADQFEDMINHVKGSQEKMNGCLEFMLPCILKTATEIENFVSRNINV